MSNEEAEKLRTTIPLSEYWRMKDVMQRFNELLDSHVRLVEEAYASRINNLERIVASQRDQIDSLREALYGEDRK